LEGGEIKMAILEMFIGIPGCGKSTHAKKMVEKDSSIVIVSSDAIRKELYGSEEDQSHNQEVFNEVFKRTRAALANDLHVIVDSTNLSRKRRIAFLKQFNNCEKRATVFAIPFEVCCEHNIFRERIVPQYAMDRMYRSFEPPHYAEGFDRIDIVRWDSDNLTIEDELAENIKCEHDNPHHSLSCGEHCLATEEAAKDICKEEYWDSVTSYLITKAARYHDVSKYKCKVFHNAKGAPTDDAHYFNHENVSAYDYMAYEAGMEFEYDTIVIANLIANHMVFYTGEAAIKKRKNIYGANFWAMLEVLNRADKAAH